MSDEAPGGHHGDPYPDLFASLDEAQLSGLGDMDPGRFRAAAHAVVDAMADYLATVEARRVLPAIEPGSIRPAFPGAPPEGPEPLGAILADLDRLVVPNATHWQHPGFLAYFATTASAPGILGEMWTAALGQNPMLWRTSPIGTELEQVVVGWLRGALGLPGAFDGLLTDTASTSTLIALAAAREAAGLHAAADGLAARTAGGTPVVYASAEAHSSVEKACMTLGLGRAALRRIPVDVDYRMRVDRLAAAIAEDRDRGSVPTAVVATIGTTSSTSVDPVAAIADVAAGEGVWLHVDAAYAGAVALVPARRGPFHGWERADSMVVNPHKWLFTPLDASLLLSRRMDAVRAAFSLVPEYLRTLDQERPVHDFTEYQPQLGRRMRALKLWILIRYFGLDGPAPPDRRPLPPGRGPGGDRRRGPRLRAACPRPVLDGLPAMAAGRLAWSGGRARGPGPARRRQRAPDGGRQRDRGGLPLAHAAPRPLRHPGGDREPADRGAPRGPGVGPAPPGGAAPSTPEPGGAAPGRRTAPLHAPGPGARLGVSAGRRSRGSSLDSGTCTS